MAEGRKVILHNLVVFEIGDLPDDPDHLALLLAYATSAENLVKGELETFAIGLSREKAGELGRALLEHSGEAQFAMQSKLQH